ncbi:MAG: Type 1 glutamine amidotransferase-like domain-containing protein [Candidatus Pacebacteria bacterium]|nr:Type 1 glutamine amidotransferase-like domain-containing protein [Candidatus Paceibacterota bacterium]
MATKFILHGGFDKNKTNEDNRLFYSEILKDASDDTNILLVPFAKDEDRIIPATEKISKEFQIVSDGKILHITVATHDDFLKQLAGADVIYFHGGVSTKLLEALKPYGDLSSYFKEKIVAGESAGANIFSTYFYSPHADQVLEGLKILPIRMIPHYTEDKKDKLNGYGDGMETVFLQEYEFKVIIK